ncbi:MAG TPA: FAD binding domain-containing protein [Roseococcus sp.]|jgi:carbon-monoxide dehydrogenase medium subunit|nr:FAD binding domain-containing protein [Roseococcus sp.]
MKPARFAHHAPLALEEALALLAAHGEEARVLAGGQSLVPTMAFRMARPAVLVDINRIAALDHITVEGGHLRIGALARHARFETPVVDGPLGALLARIAHHIAHPPLRLRGTFCGSLAHADPASEWCAAALALEARMVLARADGLREVGAEDWFQGVFSTALAPGEMLREVILPLPGPAWRGGFAEFARRAGDFALAMAVVGLRLEGGVVRGARVALGGIGGQPLLAREAMALLEGQPPSPTLLEEAAATAARHCDPQDDMHAPAEYRRELVAVMVKRALRQAVAA